MQWDSVQNFIKRMASAGGEAFVKLQIAEALQGKKIVVLPVSEGGMNLPSRRERFVAPIGNGCLEKKGNP